MKIWLIELRMKTDKKLKGEWLPIPGWFRSEKAAREVLKEEWPEQLNYARVSEYVRKGKK